MISSALPPLEYQKYQIDLQISIWRQNERYVAYIQSPGSNCYKIPIDLTIHSLSNLNRDLQQAIGEMSSCTDKGEAFTRLSELGNFAYKTIFKDENARKTIKLAINSIPPHGVIEITSEDFTVPWDLINDHEIPGISSDGFWGMRYTIARMKVLSNRPGDFTSPIVHLTRPRLGLLVNRKLKCVNNQEIPFFTKLNDLGIVNLLTLRSLDPNNKRAELKEFIKFWKEDLDLAHLACHAHSDPDPVNSRIVLSDNFNISLQDMTVYNLDISNFPLVVLNGCHTGDRDPLYVSSIADTFIQNGARGVIATEYAVPDELAAKFSEYLYSDLLDGKDLGESLMNSRRKLLWDYHSLVGLLYALYAKPNFLIMKE